MVDPYQATVLRDFGPQYCYKNRQKILKKLRKELPYQNMDDGHYSNRLRWVMDLFKVLSSNENSLCTRLHPHRSVISGYHGVWSLHHSMPVVWFPCGMYVSQHQNRQQSCGSGRSCSGRHPLTEVVGSQPDCCLPCMSAAIITMINVNEFFAFSKDNTFFYHHKTKWVLTS
jgi:hypothetical protein